MLASFIGVAALVVTMRAVGMTIGWGMHFQSPVVVLAMMALFMALGLGLSGVFTIGAGITGLGDSLTRRSGLISYFFTALPATVVATPCTAPFMGAAIGYAFAQPPLEVFAVLIALGLGFALPMVLLSYTPGLGRMLPKPGAWMETFKQLMAFPLYATAAWLLWVLSIQEGSDGVLAGTLTLIGVAFAAWLFGRSFEPGPIRTAAATAIVLAAIGLGSWNLEEGGARPAINGVIDSDASGPKAEAFSLARLAELTSQNKPIFVNLTAAWCITCKVNERLALRSDTVAKAFTDRGIAYLVGDWTNGDKEITAMLRKHGRAGVPLYLLYSGKPGAEPGSPAAAPDAVPIILDRLAAIPSAHVKQAKGEL